MLKEIHLRSKTFLIISKSTFDIISESVCVCVPILRDDYGQIDRFGDPFNAIVFICLRNQLMAPNWEIWGVSFLAYFETIQAIGNRTHNNTARKFYICIDYRRCAPMNRIKLNLIKAIMSFLKITAASWLHQYVSTAR